MLPFFYFTQNFALNYQHSKSFLCSKIQCQINENKENFLFLKIYHHQFYFKLLNFWKILKKQNLLYEKGLNFSLLWENCCIDFDHKSINSFPTRCDRNQIIDRLAILQHHSSYTDLWCFQITAQSVLYLMSYKLEKFQIPSLIQIPAIQKK